MHRWLPRLGVLGVVGLLVCQLLVPKAASAVTQPTGWHTSGAQIFTPSGSSFVISGVNWYGFETNSSVAHGLWALDYRKIVDQIVQYGYNTIRIPFSNEMW